MRRDEKEISFNWKKYFFLVLFVILVWGIWAIFFSYTECESWDCFNKNLESCDKVSFIGGTDMIFEYVIEGDSDGECEVGVQLLQGKIGNEESIKLEMQKMTCMLPKGIVMIPESDIGNCHGELKEGMQDLIIKKLYSYLVQNLGRINLEVLDVPEVN